MANDGGTVQTFNSPLDKTLDPERAKLVQAARNLTRQPLPSLSSILSNTFGSANALQQPGLIQAPGALAPQFGQQIGALTAPISAPTPISGVEGIQGFGPEFFDQLARQGTERLRRQFFDEGGVQSQVAENVASRGLVGSGVEQGIFREQIFEPFAQGSRDIQESVAIEQARQGLDLAKFNVGVQQFNKGIEMQAQKMGIDVEQFNRQLGFQGAQWLSNLAIADREVGFQADIANAELEQSYNQLQSQVALAEQGRLSQEQTADLDRQMHGIQLALGAKNDQDQFALAERQFGLAKDQFSFQKATTPLGFQDPEARDAFLASDYGQGSKLNLQPGQNVGEPQFKIGMRVFLPGGLAMDIRNNDEKQRAILLAKQFGVNVVPGTASVTIPNQLSLRG